MASGLFRFPGATIDADTDQTVAVRAPNGKFYRVTVQDIIDLAANGEAFPSLTDDGTDVEIDANLSVTGTISAPGLPTADPHVADELWSDAGVVTVSAG
jgi:hypothetical protein